MGIANTKELPAPSSARPRWSRTSGASGGGTSCPTRVSVVSPIGLHTQPGTAGIGAPAAGAAAIAGAATTTLVAAGAAAVGIAATAAAAAAAGAAEAAGATAPDEAEGPLPMSRRVGPGVAGFAAAGASPRLSRSSVASFCPSRRKSAISLSSQLSLGWLGK